MFECLHHLNASLSDATMSRQLIQVHYSEVQLHQGAYSLLLTLPVNMSHLCTQCSVSPSFLYVVVPEAVAPVLSPFRYSSCTANHTVSV